MLFTKKSPLINLRNFYSIPKAGASRKKVAPLEENAANAASFFSETEQRKLRQEIQHWRNRKNYFA